ncbi:MULTISPECIES: response regulator transcription factor [Photobacterium]|jgi:DNA-binding response OmpR family regulator|uniref:DNA-binding response regulator n=2 Tax=Photobacterium TaxID=657 RepID=A0A2T3JDA2_9GAMM|nr:MULTISPECIES: response regulator transcription factor [Photobacterium]PSU46882.1 DNA-binding response regulator [Photobacterium frigidiphilum]PSV44163.1 DNA-binding response regulator [Photobacterium indicum]
MKLLLIEDHKDIAGVIFDFFEIKGYTLDYANNGLHGYELASSNYYDLIILDVMLPRMDGFTVCQKLREQGVDTPILMLTARDTREDTLEGFAQGADDYLVKPFDLEILEARIKSLTRRRIGNTATKTLNFGELTLDLNTHIVSRNDCQFSLNPTLFTILKLMMVRAPNVVAKDELISALWGDDEPEGNVLRSHIYQLRSQIDKPFKHAYINTVPKVGYQLIDKG